ncbi:hypothetical protein JM946_14335 [Steroidobacter sp. S1-65]|uniref:Uncharacterized protein n=1 Tax=Steroidobacter gossypii TaxID=2805490 RepID=A0ABS1WY45_9GAMM|nr:hypothetical protein [Steroidobacter gossypii]MBM0105906.1 hypothetical protein [Steroidobacter gossypii]
MNKFVGYMNIVLLTVTLIALVVGSIQFEQRELLVGMVMMLVPLALTMFAMEPQPRCLHAAIIANAVVIGSIVWGAGASPALVPFLINMAALVRVWIRVKDQQGEQYRPDSTEVAAELMYEDPAENYFVRHWRGQLTLPVSYWVNNWGATALLWGLLVAANKFLPEVSLRMQSSAVLALHGLILIVGAWCAVGVWRSSKFHAARGGARVWAGAAQFLVVLGAIGTVSNFFLYNLPQIQEHWLIARDRDPLGHIETQLTRDRRGLVLSGNLGAGSADKIRAVLDQEPDVETLVLETPGGRVGEAALIARLVRERKLKTYVEGRCESACTVILIAGVDRAVTASAVIGFHRASFPGMSASLDKAMTDDLIEQYRAAGLPEDFLAQVRDTRADDMWYPTREELLGAHAIDRVSSGGEINRASKYDNKAYLEFEYAGDPIMGLINDHFAGAVKAAAAAAWQEREQGASDAAMWAAARKVILGYYQKLLRTADEPSIRSYLQIRLDQLRAARQVSDEACALQAGSSLDISEALSAELYERELTWVRASLGRMDQAPSRPPNASEFNGLMLRLEERLGSDVVAMARNPAAHAGSPQQLCAASLRFYEAVRALPQSERVLAARGLFQGVAE